MNTVARQITSTEPYIYTPVRSAPPFRSPRLSLETCILLISTHLAVDMSSIILVTDYFISVFGYFRYDLKRAGLRMMLV
jgi:hypothetical protein